MEVPHVYALTFVGRCFLIEYVPVAGAYATHENFSPDFFVEIIRQVYRVLISVGIRYPCLWTSELPGKGAPIYQYHAPKARSEAPVHRYWAIEVSV